MEIEGGRGRESKREGERERKRERERERKTERERGAHRGVLVDQKRLGTHLPGRCI